MTSLKTTRLLRLTVCLSSTRTWIGEFLSPKLLYPFVQYFTPIFYSCPVYHVYYLIYRHFFFVTFLRLLSLKCYSWIVIAVISLCIVEFVIILCSPNSPVKSSRVLNTGTIAHYTLHRPKSPGGWERANGRIAIWRWFLLVFDIISLVIDPIENSYSRY